MATLGLRLPARRALLLCGALCLPICFGLPAEGREIVAASTQSAAVLGSSYDSVKGRFLGGACLKPETVLSSGMPVSTVNFSQSATQEQLADSLGFSVGTRARFGLYNGSAAANFARQSMSDKYSIVAIYSADYKFKNQLFNDASLSNTGKKVEHDAIRRLNTCGDEFVQQITLGARLFFSIRIDFASEKDRSSFSAELNFSGPAVDVKAQLAKVSEKLSQSAKITVSSLQIGGNASKISQLFNGSSDGFGLVDCTFGSYKRCMDVLTQALDYATNVKSGFPSQISADNSAYKNDGPAILSYLTARYESIGYPEENIILTQQSQLSRKRLTEIFEENVMLSNRIDRIINSKIIRLTDWQKNSAIDYKDKLINNRNIILAAADVCYDSPTRCPQVVGAIEKLRDGYVSITWKQLELIQHPESIAQFCDLTLSNNLPPDTKHTTSSLIDLAKNKNPNRFIKVAEGETDLCGIVEDLLLKEKRITIKGQELVDLTPLQGLKDLRELDLSDNQITDISPLYKLTNLEKLNLAKNQIEDADGMRALKKLRMLDMRDNNLQTAQFVSCLPNLETINMSYNTTGALCVNNIKSSVSCISEQSARFGQISTIARESDILHEVISVGTNTSIVLGDGRTSGTGGPLIWPISQACSEQNQPSALKNLPFLTTYAHVIKNGSMLPAVRLQENHTAASLSALSQGQVIVTGGFSFYCDVPPPSFDKNIPGVPMALFRSGIITTNKTAEIIDPVTLQARVIPSTMENSRAAHSSTTLVDGRILILGGLKLEKPGRDDINAGVPRESVDMGPYYLGSFRRAIPTVLAEAEILDPKRLQFSPTGSMSVPRIGHKTILLTDGRVLVTGGGTFLGGKRNNLHRSCELFDPATGRFSPTGSLQIARANHSATLLSDGRVLIAGGMGDDGKPLASLEVYDPRDETFRLLPSQLESPRWGHGAVLDRGERVLFAGGSSLRQRTLLGDVPIVANTVEVFDIKTQRVIRSSASIEGVAQSSVQFVHSAVQGQNTNLIFVGSSLMPGELSVVEYLTP